MKNEEFQNIIAEQKNCAIDDLYTFTKGAPAKKESVHAAKLFYAIYEKEGDTVPIYKWEIRWKGDIFVSPQILTFKWNPDKDHLKIIKAKK